MPESAGGLPDRIDLYLLGPPRIERNGEPVRIQRRKAIALLAYLAVTGRRHRRDSLVNLLWPESDGTRGRAALRRTLFALRRALPGDWLAVDQDEIGLDPGADVGVDALRFRQLLADCKGHAHPPTEACAACVPLLSEAVALVHGDFLSGFSLKDSLNFDDWQLFQARALCRELIDALQNLAQWHTTQRDFEPAIAYARRKLALDPLDESTHRQLMRLYAWSGRRSDALRQIEECTAVLQDQLGAPPQEKTVELYRAIQEGRAPSLPQITPESQAPGSPSPPLALDAALPPFLAPEQPDDWPLFVAREHELSQLEGFLDTALAHRGQVVLITGEAGSGKTALIQEFTRRALSHTDLVVAGGTCNAHSGIGDPFLPLREILGLLTGDVRAQLAAGAMTVEQARRLWHLTPLATQALWQTGPDLIDTFVPGPALTERAKACTGIPNSSNWTAILTALAERPTRQQSGDLEPASTVTALLQSDLFDQYTRVLQALARQVCLVLVLDDLQWADLGSISLLFHLGRHLVGSRILIIGAYRPEEVAMGRPDLSAGSGQRERHPLEAVINEFQRDSGDITIDLGQAEGRDFVEAILETEPSRLSTGFRDMLLRQTQGHPLFTLELLRGMQDRGDLIRDGEGLWTQGIALDWETLPARVEAAIAERIDRLAPPLRTALRAASVEGEDFTAEVIARVVEIGRRQTVRLLSDELDRKHRLVRAQALDRLGGNRISRYRFRHNLFQQYLYDSLDQVERAYLHEDIGNYLEELYGDRAHEIAVELARHFQAAGVAEKAIHYLYQAGQRAMHLSAYEEARAHLSKGLALLMDLPDSPERDQQELGLQLSLGMAWMAYGSPAPEAKEALTRARELCERTGETEQICQVVSNLSILYYVRAEYARARHLAEEALNLAQQAKDAALVAVAHWCLGFILFAQGTYAAARDHLEQTLAYYDPQKHHQPLVVLRVSDSGLSALAYLACCLWCLGYPDQALAQRREAIDLARGLAHPLTLADALCYAGCMFDRMRFDPQALKQSADELLFLSQENGLAGWMVEALCFQGEALALMGQTEKGIAQIRQGIAANRSRDAWAYMPGTLCVLAVAHDQAGETQQALDCLDKALALIAKTGEHHWEAEVYRLRGEMQSRQDREQEAESSLTKALEIARNQQAKAWELRAATSLCRFHHAQGGEDRREQARVLLAEVYGWFSEGFGTPDLKEAKALIQELSRD